MEGRARRACPIPVRSGLSFQSFEAGRGIAAKEAGDRATRDSFLLGRDGFVNVPPGPGNPGEGGPQDCDDCDSFQSGEWELGQDSVYLSSEGLWHYLCLTGVEQRVVTEL